jgi:hypothetical protein
MEPVAVEAFIPIVAMLVGGLLIFSRTRLGHALADRIAGRAAAVQPALEAEVRELRGEVDALRGELAETQERLDFTERLLSAGRKEG